MCSSDLKQEIMEFVNAKVSRFSRISEVVEEKEEFVKTPTQKIRRFLYNGKRGTDATASTSAASAPAAAEGDDAAKR